MIVLGWTENKICITYTMLRDKKPPYSSSKAWGVSQWKSVTYGSRPATSIFKTSLLSFISKIF